MVSIQLSNVATTNANNTWVPTLGIRSSVLDSTNPNFVRNVFLDSTYLTLLRQGQTPVTLPLSAFFAAAATANPNISWAPIITAQPPNRSIVHPTGTTFPITASSETTITYQWKISTNGGSSYSNVTNSGVYTNATTATLSISDTTGLNGNLYKCTCTNSTGATDTSAATLTVT